MNYCSSNEQDSLWWWFEVVYRTNNVTGQHFIKHTARHPSNWKLMVYVVKESLQVRRSGRACAVCLSQSLMNEESGLITRSHPPGRPSPSSLLYFLSPLFSFVIIFSLCHSFPNQLTGQWQCLTFSLTPVLCFSAFALVLHLTLRLKFLLCIPFLFAW